MWQKHATPCFRYVYIKVVWFRCIRSNGNVRKRHETGDGNTGYPSCFRNGLTCFCHVSVYGFLQFRPVKALGSQIFQTKIITRFLHQCRSAESFCSHSGFCWFTACCASTGWLKHIWYTWIIINIYPTILSKKWSWINGWGQIKEKPFSLG